MVRGRRGAVGPRDHGLGAVAAAHLAVGWQGVDVVVEYPGAWREVGGTVRDGAQPPHVGSDRGGQSWPRRPPPRAPRKQACVEPGLPFGSPGPERLTHGPQVGPGRRAVRGRLAHQLVDGGQPADAPVDLVHGPVGWRLQGAPAQEGQLALVTVQVASFPSGHLPEAPLPQGDGDPAPTRRRPRARPPHPAPWPRHGHGLALGRTRAMGGREVGGGSWPQDWWGGIAPPRPPLSRHLGAPLGGTERQSDGHDH